MIKKAKDLRVGDVIYLPKYNAIAVVKKSDKHPRYQSSAHFWAIDFTEQVHCAGQFLGLSFNWRFFPEKDLIPVIGQAIN
jgi:hypothetical protein